MAFDVYQHGRQQVTDKNRAFERPWRMLSSNLLAYDVTVPTSGMLLRTLIHAQEARRHAESYRHFTVGACGWITRNGGQDFLVKHGANYKNGPGQSSVDEHAEDMVLSLLQSGDQLRLLSIVGMPQPDNGSNIQSPTLHPCNKCRTKLSSHPNVASNLVVVSATPDMCSLEYGRLSDYSAVHDAATDRLHKVTFATTPALFAPLPQAVSYVLGSELDIDTTEWDAKVTLPFTEWCHATRV